jgi:hypothetical protein
MSANSPDSRGGALVDGIEHGLWLARARAERNSIKPSKGDSDEGHDRPFAG